jgi:hypothetical protein
MLSQPIFVNPVCLCAGFVGSLQLRRILSQPFFVDPIFLWLRFSREASRLTQRVFHLSEDIPEAATEANAFTANFHDAAILFSLVNNRPNANN